MITLVKISNDQECVGLLSIGEESQQDVPIIDIQVTSDISSVSYKQIDVYVEFHVGTSVSMEDQQSGNGMFILTKDLT